MTTSPHDHAPQAHEMHAHGSGHGPGPVSWAMAVTATLHCLTGCAIGEVLGMVIGTALGWGDLASIALAVSLAFCRFPAPWRQASPPPCSGSPSRVRWRSPSW